MHLVRRDPHTCGVDRSRWRREDLLAQCPWLGLRTPQGLGHLLGRLGISYQRGRHYLHSPDPDYDAKLAAVATAWQAAREAPETQVLLYLDEVTVCRQPTLAPAWATRDGDQPRAQRSYRADTETRILGALNAVTGVLHSVRAAKIRLPILRTFFQTLVAAYPERTLTVVLDNWPVHFHPDLLVALVPQRHPFPYYLSASWPRAPQPTAVAQWGHLAWPIQLLPLPTYASWANPIEKVWRKLRQELGHLHPWADDLPRLRAELDRWLAEYQEPSPDLLRYVGLATRDYFLSCH